MVAYNPKTDVPDLTGKVCLVTGANVGIGYETAKALLEHNATVYLACRSRQKAEAAIETLKKSTGKEAKFHELDLSDLDQVKRSAEEFGQKEQRLDRLFNNAGVMRPPITDLTKQGYDLQFGVNVIGHYLFTKKLFPLLEKAKAESGDPARIIWLSSTGHKLASGKGLELEAAKGGESRDKWIHGRMSMMAPWTLYGLSKMGDMLLGNYYARKFPQTGVASVSVHPGVITGTELNRTMPFIQKYAIKLFGGTNEQGAYASLFSGISAPAEEINGKYAVPYGKLGTPDKRGLDEKIQDELVAWLDTELAAY